MIEPSALLHPVRPQPAAVERLATTCRALKGAAAVERVSVWVVGSDGTSASPLATSDTGDALLAPSQRAVRTPLASFPALAQALQSGAPVVIEDAATDPRFPTDLAEDFGLRSATLVALGRPNRDPTEPTSGLAGGVVIIEPAALPASPDCSALLASLEALLEVAIAQRLAQQQKARADLIVGLIESTSSSESLTDTLAIICQRLAAHIRVDRASIFLVEHDRVVPRMSCFADGRPRPSEWGRFRSAIKPSPVVAEVLRTGLPVVIDRPEDLDPWWRENYGIAALIAAPIGLPGATSGVVVLDAADARRFSDHQVRAVTTVATHLYSVIESSRIAQQRAAELRASEAQRRVLQIGSRAKSLATVAQEVAEIVRGVVRGDGCETHLSRGRGLSAELWRELAQARRPVVRADFTERALGGLRLDPVSAAVVPLMSGRRLVGAVVCRRADRNRPWREDDREVLARMVPQIALVIENTELRHADRTRNRQLRGLLDREQEVVRRLSHADELKNTFLSAISHDMRTPLTVLYGIATTLQRRRGEIDTETVDDLLTRLVRNAERLEHILVNLLDLNRFTHGVVELDRDEVDAAAIVRSCASACDLGARTLRLPPGAVVGNLNTGHFERIVDNLLINAAKYTPEDATLWIEVRREGGGVLLVVEDDGPGVGDAMKKRIFLPFERADTKHPSPGSGVGLALVSRFAELHGGRAWVEDRPGGGASFRVLLPDGSAEGGSSELASVAHAAQPPPAPLALPIAPAVRGA